jgi:polysaccharide deacetylase family protein (PEP-CTERM system associated)
MTTVPDILTVDVEEWFHGHNYLGQVPPAEWAAQQSRVEGNTDRVLELLDRQRVRATFFVLGWTAVRHPDVVRRIAAAGHEIGCHSFAHPVVSELSEQEFLADLDQALAALAACGVRPRGYRAPSFTMTPPVHGYLELLRNRGFAYDCSLFPIRHPRYGQPGSPRYPFILEPPAAAEAPAASAAATMGDFVVVPMPTWRLGGVNLPFSGGGYMRLLPRWAYRAVRAAARRQDQPCVIYLHPWELDRYRPATRQNALLRWRSQAGQGTMPAKLADLLQRGTFRTLGAYVADLLADGNLPRRSLPLAAPGSDRAAARSRRQSGAD